MINTFRIKGRKLQGEKSLGGFLVFSLYFLFIFCTGLVPMFVSFSAEKYFFENDFYSYINLTLALLCLFSAFFSFSLIRLGRKRYYFKNACEYETSPGEIFYYFKGKNFLFACQYSLNFFLVKTVVTFLCFLPFFLSAAFLLKNIRQGTGVLFSFALAITVLFLFLNGVYFFCLFSSSFFLCDYYFIKGEYLSFSQLLSLSQFMMKKRKGKLLKLKMSFCGWFMFCIFVLPLSFVSGYYNQSLAFAAKEFMG